MTRFTNKLIQTALLTSGLFLLSACGGGGDGIGNIDIAEYLPASDMVKHYEKIQKKEDGSLIHHKITETIAIGEVEGNIVIDTERKVEKLDGTPIRTIGSRTTVHDTEILDGMPKDRFVNIGDSLYGDLSGFPMREIATDDGVATVLHDCIYKREMSNLTFGELAYEGEIMETECSYISEPFILDGVERQFHVLMYSYQKKGIGTIATKAAYCKVTAEVYDDRDMGSCPADKIFFLVEFLDPADS